jgi:hypothetical protein
VFREREGADAFAGDGEDGVADGGENRREGRFAEAGGGWNKNLIRSSFIAEKLDRFPLSGISPHESKASLRPSLITAAQPTLPSRA